MTDEKPVLAQISLDKEEQELLLYLKKEWKVTTRSQVLRHLIQLGAGLTMKSNNGYTVWLRSDREELRVILPNFLGDDKNV